MVELILGILLFVLVVLCIFMVFIILLQRGSAQGGMGTAFGGGMAESTFGADTGNVLTKATVFCAVAFFVLSLGLYLLFVGLAGDNDPQGGEVDLTTPAIEEPAEGSEPVEAPLDEMPAIEEEPPVEIPESMPEEPTTEDTPTTGS